MTQEEHLEYSNHSSSNSVHDQVNDDTTKSKNITTATNNQAVVDPTTTSSRDAQTDKLSTSDSNRRLNDKQQLVDNKNKNVSVDNNNNKDKPTSECFNKTVNSKPSDNENNNNIKHIGNLTKTFDNDIVTDSNKDNKDCSKASESNRARFYNRSRQSTFDRSVSLDFEDPIERLNKLKSNITDVLKEVKAVLDKHSEPEPEKEEDIKPLDEKVIRFRFIRRIRKKTSFDLEEEQARKNILKEEEKIYSKNPDQNKMGIQNSFVISNEEHTNLVDKKFDIESHKSDISEFNENKSENESWPQENQYNESSNSQLSYEGNNTNVDTTKKSSTLIEERKSNDDQLKLNLVTLNKQIEPQETPSTRITTSINQTTNNESTQGSSIKTDNDELVKTIESVVVINKTESNETPSVNDKSIEEKPKKKIVKKSILSSSKEKVDSNKSTEAKIDSSTNKSNTEKLETEISKSKLNNTSSLGTSKISSVENKIEVKDSSQTKVITSPTTESIPTKKSTSESPKEKTTSENKNEVNKISSPPKTTKTSSIEQVDKSNKTEPVKKPDLNLKEVKKEEKPTANQKTTTENKTEMAPQSTEDLTKKEAPTEDVVKKKIVKKVIKPATNSSNDIKTAVKTTKEVQKETTVTSEGQMPTTALSNESAPTKEEPTDDKTKKKVLKKITKTTAKVLPVEITTENNKNIEQPPNNIQESTNSISPTLETPLNEEISTDKTKKKIIKKPVNDNEKKVTKIVKPNQIKPTEQNKTIDSPVKSTESNAATPTTSPPAATSVNKNISSSIKNSNLIETNHTTNQIKAENKLPTAAKDKTERVAQVKTASLIPIPAKTVVPEPPKDVIPVSKNEVVPGPAKEVVSVLSKDGTTVPIEEAPSTTSTTPANQASTKLEMKETKDEKVVKVTSEVKSEPKTTPTFTVTAPKGELNEEKNLKLTSESKTEVKIPIRRRPSAPEQLEGNKIVEKVILRRRPSSLLPDSLSTEQKSDTTSAEKTFVRRRPSSLILNSAEQKDETTKPTRRRPSSLLSNTSILEQNSTQVEPTTKKSESKSKEEVIESKSTPALSDNSSSSFPQLDPKNSPLSSPLSPTSKSMGSSALDKVLAITNLKPITDKKVVSTIIVKPPMSMMLQSQKSIEKLAYEPSINKTIVPVRENSTQQQKISTASTPVAESTTSMKQISEKDLTDNRKKVPSASINALTTSIPQEVDLKSMSNKTVTTTAEPVVSSGPQKTTEQKIPTPSSPTTLDIPGNKTIKNKKVEQPPTKTDEISKVPRSPIKDELKIKQDDKTKEDVVVVTSKKSSISLDNSIGKTQENNKQTNQHAHIPNEKETTNKKEPATKTDKTKTNDVSSYQQKSATESANNKIPTKIASEKTSKPILKTPSKIENKSVTTVAVKPKLTLLPAPSKAVQLVPIKLDVIPVQKPSVVKTVEIKKPTPQIPVLEQKPQEESVEPEKTANEQLVEQPGAALVTEEIKVELEKEEVTQSSSTPSTELEASTIKTVEAETPLVDLPKVLDSSSASTVTPSEVPDVSLEEPPTAPSESVEATTEAVETEGQDNDALEPPKKPKKKKLKKKSKIIKVVIKRIKRKLSKDDTPLVEVEPEICEKEIEPKPDEPDSEEEEEEPEPPGPIKPKSCMKPREYEPGDIVMYADRIRKMVKWKKATVLERITSISYKLDVNGEEKSAHICYIKKYTDKKVQFGGKEYLEIDYAQLEAEEEEPEYNIWARV